MTWGFELNLTIFLLISAFSFFVTVRSRSLLSLPFVFGILFMIAYGFALIPKDFIGHTKLLDVGIIAYNVLIIHAGTSFSLKLIKRNGKAFLLVCLSVLISGTVYLLAGWAVLGKQMTLLAIPSMIGGGASCAIASISIQNINPQLSFFPWMIFMFQSFFGIPLFLIMMKRIKAGEIIQSATVPVSDPEQRKEEIRPAYKSTAYYLAILMSVSLVNRFLFNRFLADTGISINLTALLFGVLLGELKLIDRSPLQKADCFGLLMLGLMSLMAYSLSFVPLQAILGLLPVVLISFLLFTILLAASAWLLSRPLKLSAPHGVALAVSALVAAPANLHIINALFRQGSPEARTLIEESNMGSVYMINILSVLIISIAAAFL